MGRANDSLFETEQIDRERCRIEDVKKAKSLLVKIKFLRSNGMMHLPESKVCDVFTIPLGNGSGIRIRTKKTLNRGVF